MSYFYENHTQLSKSEEKFVSLAMEVGEMTITPKYRNKSHVSHVIAQKKNGSLYFLLGSPEDFCGWCRGGFGFSFLHRDMYVPVFKDPAAQELYGFIRASLVIKSVIKDLAKE